MPAAAAIEPVTFRAPPFDVVMAAPFGRVGLRVSGSAIDEIVYLPPATPLQPPAGPLAAQAVREIARYLDDPRHRPELPLAMTGTPFQCRVRAAISAIPAGEFRTYGALARSLGSSPRAVGQACGSNPFPLVVPCHRVLARDGLGGFAHARDGFLLDVKRWLLAHEGIAGLQGRLEA